MHGALDDDIVHATTVAIAGAGVLILGPSGAGKSALALQMMALGARLVADDRTCLTATPDGVLAAAPPALAGLIEARGLGILRAPAQAEAWLALAVDLGQAETERLPPRRSLLIKGHPIDLVFGPPSAHFPASLLCLLSGGRHA